MKTNIGKAISLLNTLSPHPASSDKSTLTEAITLLKHEDEARQPLVPLPQPDKATAPIRQLGTFRAEEGGYRTRVVLKDESFNLFGLSASESQSQADRIDHLLTEHAALVAVAEAANQLIYTQNATRSTSHESIVSTLSVQHVRDLLAALAVVRGRK